MAALTSIERLSGLRKAAIFLVSIGTNAAAEVYSFLSEEEIEQISEEIARLDSIPSHLLNDVNHEYYQMVLAQKYIAAGGISFAQEALVEALGEQKAMEI
ncbi:MAG: flagellar motor switch protein FliG, partial [bacterium]|nr:flagellar motor switch protein FliG [bacterium]